MPSFCANGGDPLSGSCYPDHSCVEAVGTSQVHQDDRFLMKMGLDESTLSSKHRERLRIVWAHGKLRLDETSSSSLLDQEYNHYQRRLLIKTPTHKS